MPILDAIHSFGRRTSTTIGAVPARIAACSSAGEMRALAATGSPAAFHDSIVTMPAR